MKARKAKKLKEILVLLCALIMLFSSTVIAQNEGVSREVIKNGVLIDVYTIGETYKTPEGVREINPIATGHMIDGRNLKHLIISEGVKNIGVSAFGGSSNRLQALETVEMADVEIIGEFAFANNKNLKSVKLSVNIKEIRVAAFKGASSLKEIHLPEGLQVIGQEAFVNSGLKEIEVPGTVKKLENLAFSNNVSLEKVVLNEGVEEIGVYVFSSCKLKQIFIPASVTKIDSAAFERGALLGMTVYTPKGSYAERYAKEKGWMIVNTDEYGNIPETKEFTITYNQPVKAVREYIDLGSIMYAKHYPSQEYDVEIWTEDTEVKFVADGKEYLSVTASLFINNQGVIEFGDDRYGWYKNVKYDITDEYKKYAVKSPAGAIVIDKNGKEYSEKSKELYGLITYTYAPLGQRVANDNRVIKIVKFDIADKTVPTNVNATPTNSKVIVNGKEVEFDAYTINGNNYFKLRDLAFAVRKTDKRFNVVWDNERKAINLISNEEYKIVGGEMNKGDGKIKTGVSNTSKIYKDGRQVKMVSYTINGNNYFKLRDIASVFDIGVIWKQATNTVGIDTNIGYFQEANPVTIDTYQLSEVEMEVVRLVNIEREKEGLEPFVASGKLSYVAKIKSEDMSSNRYFDHNSPTYGSPFEMMKSFDIKYLSAAENIAMGQATAERVVEAWMNSPGHRANILNPRLRQLGVGCYQSADGTNYWTQMFTD